MEHGWISTLPLCLDELDINRNMNTSPIATSFPFSSPDLTDDHGILYGINRHNDSLVIFDRFDLPNANATVFATSGAGKSFAVKLEILRALMFGTEVFVIDPENEYVELCETVGGTFIPVSLQSSFRINPFDLPKAVRGEEAGTGEVLRAAAITLHGLFKLMLGTLTPSEDGILDKAILDTYALKGITLTTEKPAEIEPPTLNELVDVLSTTEGGENMAQTLMKYTKGSYAGLFDQPTNVELNKQMVIFQIRDLEEQLRPIAMYVILNFIWNRIRADFKKRFLVIDEAWNMMQHEDSARFLFGLIKRARKYYLGVTTITQDIEDFVNSPYGKPIITNASLQILLKQSPTAVDNLQKLFYLTDGEKYLLLNSDVGQGLFFAGNKHVAIQIVASPKEQTIITTKPEEVLAKMELKKREKQEKTDQGTEGPATTGTTEVSQSPQAPTEPAHPAHEPPTKEPPPGEEPPAQ
jgi:type IV secretory pathway VirB4 component